MTGFEQLPCVVVDRLRLKQLARAARAGFNQQFGKKRILCEAFPFRRAKVRDDRVSGMFVAGGGS